MLTASAIIGMNVKALRVLILACLCQPLLSACSKKPAPAQPVALSSAPAPAPVQALALAGEPSAALMQAVYGKDWNAKLAKAVTYLPDDEDRSQEQGMVVTYVAQSALANGDTVLVTNAVPADEKGEAMIAHVTLGMLNVYVLRKVNGTWETIKSHPSITRLGSSGSLGEIKWVSLGKDRLGLAVLHGGTWQGSTIELLSLFDPQAEVVTDLTDQVKIASDNEGGCDPAGDVECWKTVGDWKMAPSLSGGEMNDIVIAFTHEASNPIKDAQGEATTLRDSKKSQMKARYVFDGKKYRLMSGTNPVRTF